MSDGVWIALITAFAAIVGPIVLAVVQHHLGKKDRELASKTTTMKNRELRTVRTENRRLMRENRMLRLRRPRPRPRSRR